VGLLSHCAADDHRAGSRAGEVVVDLQKTLAAHRIDIESAMRAFLSRQDWRDAAKLAGNPYPSSATLPHSRSAGPVVPDPQKIIFDDGKDVLAHHCHVTRGQVVLHPPVILVDGDKRIATLGRHGAVTWAGH
jgi:hypothetical protein